MRQPSFPLPVTRRFRPKSNRRAEARRLIPVLVVVLIITFVCGSLHAATASVAPLVSGDSHCRTR